MGARISWVLMLILGISLIVIGFQGNLGLILGCILTPSLVTMNEGQ